MYIIDIRIVYLTREYIVNWFKELFRRTIDTLTLPMVEEEIRRGEIEE